MKKNIWCTNDIIDKRVLSEDEIPNGFHRGRKKNIANKNNLNYEVIY